MSPKLFRFTHFPKNASTTPLDSHTFKTKDLKPFRFTHFQKKGRGWVPLSNIQPQNSNLRSSLNPVASTLTRKLHLKPFRINTYKKGGEGEGVRLLSTLNRRLSTMRVHPLSTLNFRLSTMRPARLSPTSYLLPPTSASCYNPPARCPVGARTSWEPR